MQVQLAVYTLNGATMLADWSTRVTACEVRTNNHGFESCEAELGLPFYEAFNYYQQFGPLLLRVSWGPYRIWEGRLEDPTQFTAVQSGLKITAFGFWVAYNDAPYVALWSTASLSDWSIVTSAQIGNAIPDQWNIDTNNRLYLSCKKGATYAASGAAAGMLTFVIPDQSTRQITGVQFAYSVTLPVGFTARLDLYSAGYAYGSTIWTLNGTGANLVGCINGVVTASDRLVLLVFNATAGAIAPAGEDGANFVKLTSVRVTTSTSNRVNTTLGTTIAAGTRTVTPGNMARIYVGQSLFINQNAVGAEVVTVTAITSTTFTAVFANAHNLADSVTAHVVYPDEIIKDCVTALDALNPTQLSADLTLIQSQAVDLDQAIYEDQYPTDIINALIAKADNQTTPRQWVAMVYNDQALIVRPRGSGQQYYADITSLQIVRTLTNLYNSVYAVYKDTLNKRNLRTTTNADAVSVAKFGITRRKAQTVDTTSAIQAGIIRDGVLALQTDPIPRVSIELDKVFNARGQEIPAFMVRTDDLLTIRNLPPTIGSAYDKIRTLVITRTSYNLITQKLTLELEIPLPNTTVQLAQALKGK